MMTHPWHSVAMLELENAVRAGGGSMRECGRWRYLITGPDGTIIITARGTWPHRKMRWRIRQATGVVLHAHAVEAS